MSRGPGSEPRQVSLRRTGRCFHVGFSSSYKSSGLMVDSPRAPTVASAAFMQELRVAV